MYLQLEFLSLDVIANGISHGVKMKIENNKRSFNVEIENGQSILEACITANVNPPYSCLEGHCGACEARLLKGEVLQEGVAIKAPAMVRTCMSKPANESCELSYDSN